MIGGKKLFLFFCNFGLLVLIDDILIFVDDPAAAAAAETVSISSRVAHCADQLGRDDVSPALLAACVNIIFKAARYAPASTAKFFMHISSQGSGIDPDLFLELLSNKDLTCVAEMLKANEIVQQWIFSQEFSTFHRDYAVCFL